jgi:CRP-like cAMP-binding protein
VAPGALSRNTLLAELPVDDLRRLVPDLRLLSCKRNAVLCDMGQPSRHIYFPISAAIGHEVVLADGTLDAIEMIGPEGAAGLAMVLGGESLDGRSIVRVSGYAYALAEAAVMREFRRGGALQALLLRYAQRRLMELARSAVCDRRHSSEQRVSRWLLLSTERLRTRELTMTQEGAALSLGLRREAVSRVLSGLQRARIVHCSRGTITLLDRHRLEARSCECYESLSHRLPRPSAAPAIRPRPVVAVGAR